jgi:hypothetical protein
MVDTALIGKAKELQVAGRLVAAGLYVYFPLVDNGFDLVVSNKSGSLFVPVQVKFKQKRSGFSLKKDDVKKFLDAKKTVVVFGSDSESSSSNFWFFPILRAMLNKCRQSSALI